MATILHMLCSKRLLAKQGEDYDVDAVLRE